MKYIYFFLLYIITTSCSYHEFFSLEANNCYGFAIIPDYYEENEGIYPVYNGLNYSESDFLVEKSFIIQHKMSDWQKKSTPNKCSPPTEDCAIWCLVEIPEIIEHYWIVIDTNSLKEFDLRPIYSRTNFIRNEYEKEVEVVCKHNYDQTMVLVQSFLLSQNLLSQLDNKSTMRALRKYQKDNRLARGPLSIETLKHMKIIH